MTRVRASRAASWVLERDPIAVGSGDRMSLSNLMGAVCGAFGFPTLRWQVYSEPIGRARFIYTPAHKRPTHASGKTAVTALSVCDTGWRPMARRSPEPETGRSSARSVHLSP